MKSLPALAVVCLLFVPPVAVAQQISPNPNPVGNTLSVNTSDAINDVSFTNHGTINFKNYEAVIINYIFILKYSLCTDYIF